MGARRAWQPGLPGAEASKNKGLEAAKCQYSISLGVA